MIRNTRSPDERCLQRLPNTLGFPAGESSTISANACDSGIRRRSMSVTTPKVNPMINGTRQPHEVIASEGRVELSSAAIKVAAMIAPVSDT